ncbi:hypothetical protein [Paenibacillus paridis]|uniref:hypothetical protein n=1 Tax=Paenibacillus paridis TaxID=2583376 RepID=UPI0013915613|nr:hypothetical protein [Paenibacillus paridis]
MSGQDTISNTDAHASIAGYHKQVYVTVESNINGTYQSAYRSIVVNVGAGFW